MEDNADDRHLLARLVEVRGHTVLACADAESGWDAFRRESPPLVLLDVMLPGVDGLELCRRIRGHPRGHDTLVLGVTAKEDPAILERLLEAGADDYVPKPVDPAVLAVRMAVAERGVREHRQRARAEAELALKSREIEVLFRNLDAVFFSLDVARGQVIQVSPAAKEMLGHEPQALTADPELGRAVLLPPELEAQQEALARLEPDRMLVHAFPYRHPDGARLWLEASLKAELDAEGRPVRIDGVLTDVTERRRAQEELAARNEELATLYRVSEVTLAADSADEAYADVLDEVRATTTCPLVTVERHDAARGVLVVVASLGYPDAEGEEATETPVEGSLAGEAVLTQRPLVEVDASRRSDRVDATLRGVTRGTYMAFPLVMGSHVGGVLTLAHPDPGTPRPRHVRWAGSVANTLASFMERDSAEDALRESERSHRELAEKLQQANRELESFAYSVSHDLRAPLRTMQGFAHALLQNFGDTLDPEARDYARRIIASGQQSERLISDLLAYSRLSFEEVELQDVDLDQVVAVVREQLGADLGDAGARLDVEGSLPRVQAHVTTLVQVLSNLVSNAVKFVPPDRSPEIRVLAEPRDAWTRLWVVDNGVGIPEGQEERIFRVFERLADSAQRPGTGIGLAIVRRGMERIGGKVGVERRADGPGSAFWVDIPAPRERRAWRPWGRRGRRS